MDDEKIKESEYINLKISDQENNAVMQFKIKRHAPLKKPMNAYCELADIYVTGVRFRLDGNPITESKLEMEEGDTIVAYFVLPWSNFRYCYCHLQFKPYKCDHLNVCRA